MDFYLSDSNVYDRLYNEYKKYGQIIVAYDFDNTVYDYHCQGHKYNNIIELLKECRKIGMYLIVFTASNDTSFIKEYLNQNNIPFDKINENLDFIKFYGRKIYYNILLDDRAGLSSSYKVLSLLVKNIKKEKNYEN